MNTAIAGEKTSGALPPLVRQFVERNAPTAPAPSRIRLRQKGSMQLKPGRWRAFTAEQEMSVERVKFSWRVPLITVDVHDWYRAAEGGLEVRVLGLPLGRMRGGDISEGRSHALPGRASPGAAGDGREPRTRVAPDRRQDCRGRHVLAGGEPRGPLALRHKGRHRRLNSRPASSRRRRACGRHALPRRPPRLRGSRRLARANYSRGELELPEGPFTYFRGRTTELTPIS